MNYAKVYSQFIADRKSKESDLLKSGDYFEKHHIIPKKLGGNDCNSNLILLSAEDHIRAHLLIAKIYGGSMWAPIVIMSSTLGRRIPTRRTIKIAAIARSNHALSLSGSNNSRYDKTIYHFKHDELGELLCTRAGFVEKIGGGNIKNAAHFVINEKKHYKGWYLAQKRPGIGFHENHSGKKHHNYKSEIITLEHFDGSFFSGTRLDINNSLNISKPRIAGIVNGSCWESKGWGLPGWVSKKNHSKVLAGKKRRKNIINLTTGLKYACAKTAARELGLSYAGICKAASGFSKESGGYKWSYF
jgi:hypothetical protein